MGFKYSKLRGRIIEKFRTLGSFAEAVGISGTALSKKLNGTIGISQDDMTLWAELLDIELAEYGDYFFT